MPPSEEDSEPEPRPCRRGKLTGYRSRDSTDGYDGDMSSDGRPLTNRRKQLTPDKYDGKSTEWNEYLTHFNIVAQVNGWAKRDRAIYLAGSLTGQARRVVATMTPEQYQDWEVLTTKLSKAFDPPHQEEAHRAVLRSRSRKKEETFQEFGYSLSVLAQRAYPRLGNNRIRPLHEGAGRWRFPDGGFGT